MVYDAVDPEFRMHPDQQTDEAPNKDAQDFYDLLNAAQKPLWSGCKHTELSFAVRMTTIKSEGNISQRSFNETVSLIKELPPEDNGCMLFYTGDDMQLKACKFCGRPRYHLKKVGRDKYKEVPMKRMHYLPLIPRLKRLYASMSSAPHMRWDHENRRQPGVLCHPSDGEAWKEFDRKNIDFAKEPRNVWLGLCSDGFLPFGNAAKPYSCWPVIVTPYNLPPELCMTTPYMFLTLIIPGPNNPKEKIDVYLQPLIDELKLLWNEGVLTYDISKKQNFMMKAALLWTINDFPAYGMLSGWSTAGKLACPYCMNQSKAFWLKHGVKCSWFDFHRQFLPMDHAYRRNKDAFYKNRVVTSIAPRRLTGDQMWEEVSNVPKVTETQPCVCPGYGVSHNWIKQSIFWELPYWKSNLIRHNLDMMHIEKNVFENVFNTVMDIKGKTKDNVKAKMDLKEYCRQRELELVENPGGKPLKPKAKFVLSNEQQMAVCKWVSELKMPDGYASNLSRCVNIRKGNFIGMKSHDCHIFMERLLPIAFSALPLQVWKPIAELSKYFKDLCSSTLKLSDLLLMEQNIIITTCKLERIFPPGFFNSMEHLHIHLAYEAITRGPIQYRWMYPFERYLGRLKRMVKNKSRVEGSICEAYLCQETSHFCSYYFESHVQSARNRVGRNDAGSHDDVDPQNLSIFSHPGRTAGTSRSRYLTDMESAVAHLHILLNCDEVKPFIERFEQHLEASFPNISRADIDGRIASEFPTWFRSYVHDRNNMVDDQLLHHLAWGPNRKVETWPIYFVNGFKFHTKEWSVNKKTINSRVCVEGDDE
ncbi:uncharacterized protein LOC130712785 [Lotus japonicus]|uniref:uncharacterized protein LOC130712785 n=1 Tax=Lotus japonicus TaxID=34305 RepID=UPI002588938F|nr:uncharacterized protein LOC130712785 [Lotus japonicus]